MPLMNRTVREESGAASLLKKAAVRAKAAASSSAGTMLPKFPNDVVGAWDVLNTARMFPARSATATTIGAFTEFTALCTIVFTSDMLSGTACGGGVAGVVGEGALPTPPHDRHNTNAAQTTSKSPETLRR